MDDLRQLREMRKALLEQIAIYQKKIDAFEIVLSEYDQQLHFFMLKTQGERRPDNHPASPSTILSSVGESVNNVKPGEFVGKRQVEAVKSLVAKNDGHAVHIGDIVNALEQGGSPVGGSTFQKKKDNLSSTLSRSGALVSIGGGMWVLAEREEPIPEGLGLSDKEGSEEILESLARVSLAQLSGAEREVESNLRYELSVENQSSTSDLGVREVS